LEYWRKVFKDKKRKEAEEAYRELRRHWSHKADFSFIGQHPVLDKIIQEILDDALKHGVIEKLPDSKKDLE